MILDYVQWRYKESCEEGGHIHLADRSVGGNTHICAQEVERELRNTEIDRDHS